ncbi:MAG: tetratricopeptide repeat protein [Gammaproteobacteria bacterium]|nr:tetratricopeptide repeat protein [Gammaproteobacteria bacterium]
MSSKGDACLITILLLHNLLMALYTRPHARLPIYGDGKLQRSMYDMANLPAVIRIAAGAVLLLAACTPVQKKDSGNTLKVLEDKANQIVIEKDSAIDHAREKAMGIYKEFEKTDTNKSLRSEAQRRLADLELEQSDDVYSEQSATADRGKAQAGAPDADAVREQKSRSAIRIYEDLLATSKDSANNDKIMYQLAKAYENAGEPRKAAKTLDDIAVKYPNVAYAGELHFRRGELHFLLNNFKSAEGAYAKVLELGEFSLFYEKALYKQGWTLFKLEKHDPSLNAFFHLLDRKLVDVKETTDSNDYFGAPVKGKEKNAAPISDVSRGEKELISDTLRVINLNLGYLDGANSIKAYFDKNGHRPYEHLIYEQLGSFYLKQERFRDAADTYLTFARNSPAHPRAPLFYVKVMEAYQRGGFAGPLLETKKSFVDVYGLNGPYWSKYDEAAQGRIFPYLKANMEEIARHYHALAQKSKKSQDYDNAVEAYRAYVKSFPKDEKTALMNFRLAEVLFEAKRYEDAIKEYETTAYQYRNFERGAEAAYAALLAYAEREKQLQGKDQDTMRSRAIGSAVRFGKVYPNDSRAPVVLTKIAEDLFAVKKYDQAAEVARQVLEVKPVASAEQRLTAWTIVAHASLEKGDYSQAEASYKVALSLAPQSSPQRDDLVNGMAAAIYKQGELLRKGGDLRAAIAQFARVKDVAPGSTISTSASYDIAVSQLNAKNWAAAIAEFEIFRNSHPNHELVADATQNIVVASIELEKFEKAADELTRLLEYKTDPEFKRQGVLQIAGLYEKAGKTDKWLTTTKRYIAQFPNPINPGVEARQKLADYYGKSEQKEDRQYWLREIVKTDQTAGAARTDQTRVLAAKASYELAQPTYDAYRDVRLVEPLKANLKKKKDKMQVALSAYKNAADYGVAEVTTASTFQIGEIYRDLAKQLIESQRPPGLSPEELEQYGMLLEEQAFPFEEKAIEIHETNVKRVSDGLYDQWVRNSFGVLTKLLPVRYAKTERVETIANVTP